jgi:Raf kinase inhibitor-like YbhB/YbcL family protein
VIPAVMSLVLSSAQFAANGAIPAAQTCEGADKAPALSWTGVPKSAKSLALVVDDPDAPDPKAPKMTWVHWVLYDLPPSTTSLPEGVTGKMLPPGTKEGANGWNAAGYRGPCPPIGRHRYFFKLYALDTVLAQGKLDEKQLLAAIKGHVVAEGQLVGTYEKTKK